MKRLVIAYHAYAYGVIYDVIVGEQFVRLVSSNLFDACNKLYIGINDSPDKAVHPGVNWIANWFRYSRHPKKVTSVIYPDNQEMRCTLRWVRDHAKENPDDYILFIHSKGVTNWKKEGIVYEAVADWRRYMEHFVIERWQDCVSKLDEGYDACGVLWNSDTPLGYYPHFSGAFYWAKGSFINTLDHSYLETNWRYGGEMWIGTNPKAKIFEFHNSRLNDKVPLMTGASHYYKLYPRENYVSRAQ